MSKPELELRLGVTSELWTGPIVAERADVPPPPGWLVEARRAGFAGVEFDPGLYHDPRDLTLLLHDHGLALAAIPFVGGLLELTLDEERRRLGPTLDLALGAGGRLLAYADFTRSARAHDEVPLPERHQLRRDDVRRYGEKLTRLADWLAGEGVALCYQPRLGTIIESVADTDLLLASSDVTVGLALDTGVVAFGETDPATVIERHPGRLRHLRLQGVREDRAEIAREERWSFRRIVQEGVLTVPGDEAGFLDLAAIGRSLGAAGYQGWIIAAGERDPGRGNPLEEAEMGFAALTQVAEAATAARKQPAET